MMINLADYFPNRAMVEAGYVLRAEAPRTTERVTWVQAGRDVTAGGEVIMFGMRGMYEGNDWFAMGDQYVWAPDANGVWYIWTITLPNTIRTYERYVDPEALPHETESTWSDPAGRSWEFVTEVSASGKSQWWSWRPTPPALGTRYVGMTIWRRANADRWIGAEIFEIGDTPIDGGGYASGLRRFQHWDAADTDVDCRGTWYPDWGGVCLTVDEVYRWSPRSAGP